jgi:hypothetical protein
VIESKGGFMGIVDTFTDKAKSAAKKLASSLVVKTSWCLSDSAGGEITVGFEKILYGGGTGGKFYFKEDSAQSPVGLKFTAVEFGAGLGVTAGEIFSVALSAPGMPSAGTGRIYRNPLRSSGTFGLDDIKGDYVAVSVNASAGAGGSATIIFLGAPGLVLTMLSAITGPAMVAVQIDGCMALCKGTTLFTGTAGTSSLGVGVTLGRGVIF